MDLAPSESESISRMLSTFPNAVRTGWDDPSDMGHLVGGRDENQISNKTETGEGEETEEEEEKMLLRTDGTDGRTWKCRDTQEKWMLES